MDNEELLSLLDDVDVSEKITPSQRGYISFLRSLYEERYIGVDIDSTSVPTTLSKRDASNKKNNCSNYFDIYLPDVTN